MRILVTNDDGISAPGIELLARVLESFGEVWVIAPDRDRSGVSHAITLNAPLRIEQLGPRRFVCDGTPTDSVYLAINQMKLAPDLVVSGVNPGPNLGQDVLYSGTVAGALEGAHWGIPSVAISHCSTDLDQFAALEPLLPGIVELGIEMAKDFAGVININLPAVERAPYLGVRLTKTGVRRYSTEVHERRDPRGRIYYWIGGERVTMPDLPGSDCNAVREGYISITPVGDDLTNHDALAKLQTHLQAGTSTDAYSHE